MELINGQKITLGTCYYPEHWDKNLWREDLERMKECGIEVVRIAEFAWSKIEPREGEFTYEFFNKFLDLAYEMNVKVIFCTPTATPPAWLTEKYPETLNAAIDGTLYRHGGRRHYNYNSPKYRELAKRIVEKSASHYGPHPAIIGWQIDNEINCEKSEFYSESDTAAFRIWLREKYNTLDTLNEAWGTVFWNQTYTDWSQIYVPRPTPSSSNNPHQVLDYTRFISDSACRFAALQSSVIRKYKKPEDFITTNGIFSNLDNHRMREESLDFITYDSYPNFAYCRDRFDQKEDSLRDRMWSRNLMEVRSISSNFGIMEQQSGANGWNTGMAAPTPKPGQMTLWTMQSIAHGADYISYFRWRTCTVGTEIYWHGLLDYSGRDNRRIAELKEIHKKTQCLSELAGSVYKAEAAVIRDYDNIWDSQLDTWHNAVEWQSQLSIFRAAQKTHTPLDYVYLRETTTIEQLQKYKVLFYPHPVLMSPERASLLEQYTAQGGTLIIGCRSAYKDMNGRCTTDCLPGLLKPLTGTDIPEYTLVSPEDTPPLINWDGQLLEAAVFNDQLTPVLPNAQVLALYENCYYEGTPALIKNTIQKGTVYHYGAAFNEQAAEVFLEKLDLKTPYEAHFTLPPQCEIAPRSKDGTTYYFILNYSNTPAVICLPHQKKDLFTQTYAQGTITLPPYGVKVYQ